MYKGSFVDGIKEGFGTFVWPDSEGQWKKDEPNGKDKKKWPDGSADEGECSGANHDRIPVIDASC